MFDSFIPEELQKSVDDIRNEMLSQVSDDLDKTQGSFIFDSISPVAIKIAELYLELQEILKRAFVQYSYGEYLDLKAQEYGLQRKPATKSTGSVVFEGAPGTVIPAGTIVSTEGDSTVEPLVFKTVTDVVIGDSGKAIAEIEAIEGGKKGNVPAFSIILLGQYISGVARVFNPFPTSGGTDEEDDESLRSRILSKVQEVRSGGNIWDIKNWALEVDGVGKAEVCPARYGPGTVGVYILDSNLEIPTDSLVEEVQNYLSPKYRHTKEAETLQRQGEGINEEDLEDDSGISIKMSYSSTGGTIFVPLDFLERAGVWRARIRMKVDDTSGNSNLLRISFMDEEGNIAYKSPLSSERAEYILKASDLADYFFFKDFEFYYSGKALVCKIERLQDDTLTNVYVDFVNFESLFGKDTGECKVPIGMAVYVEKPEVVNIRIYARLVLKNGYVLESVKNEIEEKIEEYLKELALSGGEISYAKISGLMLGTKGVYDVLDLRLNGGIGNIDLERWQIPVLFRLEVVS